MISTGYLGISTGIAFLGAAVLLFAPPGPRIATSEPDSLPEINTAANPVDFNFGDIYQWVGPGGLAGNTGSVAWEANNTFGGGGDSGTANAATNMQTANQVGPFTFNLNNLKTISFSQTPSDTNPTGSQPVFNAGDATAWLVGLAGLGSSTGNVGWDANNTFGGGNGGLVDGAGTLQTANQLGPMVFDLNVLKAMSFTQPPNGTVLPDGQLDNVTAVDIGRWRAGIPGVFSNTGSTGFVTDRGYGIGLGTANWVGGLQTTTQIGPMTFDFNFLPAISAGDAGISFSMAPGLSAAGTPFEASDPPQPGAFATALAGEPPPAAEPAPFVSDPPPAGPDDTPKTTSRINTTTTPKPGIPGVNGTPLRSTPKPGGMPGVNGNPLRDMFDNAIAGFTGTTAGGNPPTGGSGTTAGGNPPTGGSGEGTGETG
jgi:hypothetical protein